MSDDITKFNVRGLGVDRLKTIYYVGLTESMTKAGDLLGLCQSAVSRQIHSIEEELGVILFLRRDRRVELTKAGLLLKNASQKVLYVMDAALKSVKEEREGLSGPLKVLTFPSFASLMAPGYLLGFKDEYPDIDLSVLATLGEMPITETDVIIRAYAAEQPDLEQLILYYEYIGLYAHKKYLEKFGIPQTLQDLDQHRLIAIDPELEKRYEQLNWVLKVGVADSHYYRKPHVILSSHEAIGNAILEGIGISGLGHHHIQLMNNPDIVQVLPEYTLKKGPICFSFNKQVDLIDRYMILYEYLLKMIQKDQSVFSKI